MLQVICGWLIPCTITTTTDRGNSVVAWRSTTTGAGGPSVTTASLISTHRSFAGECIGVVNTNNDGDDNDGDNHDDDGCDDCDDILQ